MSGCAKVSLLMEENVTVLVALVALVAPVTAGVAGLAAILRDWLRHRHQVEQDHLRHEHEIARSFLARALDPTVPPGARQRLLRFLSSSSPGATKVPSWASAELLDASIEVGVTGASAPPEIAPTPEAVRAGLFATRDLTGVDLRGADLRGADLNYASLSRANLSGTDLSDGSLLGADLRQADLTGATLAGTFLRQADLRGAVLRDCRLSGKIPFKVQHARLEGADLTGATIEMDQFQVCYDHLTKWPEGFDPAAHGAVVLTPA